MQIRLEFFCAKLLTGRQTDKQINNDDYISSLAEVTSKRLESERPLSVFAICLHGNSWYFLVCDFKM